MFFGLAFLPSHEVSDPLVQLISICPDKIVCTELYDYNFNNYIDDRYQSPPNIWAEGPTYNPKYLYGIYKLFYYRHTFLYIYFLERLMQLKVFIEYTILNFTKHIYIYTWLL